MKIYKKIIALVLLLTMCITLTACGGSTTYYNLGDTVSTDLFEFTLDEADFAIALNNVFSKSNDNYYLPKEYDPKADAQNPFVAPKGHTLVALTYTVKSFDRDYSTFSEGCFVTAEYKNKEYKADSSDDFNNGAYYLYADTQQLVNGKLRTYSSNTWYSNPSKNLFLAPGEIETRRSSLEIATEVENLNDEFYLTVSVPNSEGKKEKFTYHIPERSITE